MSNQQPDGTSEPTTPLPPAPPSFKPGSAPLPQPPNPDYPPTSEFPAAPTEHYRVQSYEPPPGYGPPQAYEPPPGYGPPPGYAQPGYQQPPPPPPRRSKTPMVLLVLAITLLLCGGVATAGVLFVRNVTDRAKEALPELPQLPSAAPQIPDLPTELPSLPGNVPDVTGRKITVTYEVKGTGQASQILYTEKLGAPPKRLQDVNLPWKITTEMETPALVSVVAMRVGASEGTIECRALVDGAEVKQRTSSPSNVATATCTHFAIE